MCHLPATRAHATVLGSGRLVWCLVASSPPSLHNRYTHPATIHTIYTVYSLHTTYTIFTILLSYPPSSSYTQHFNGGRSLLPSDATTYLHLLIIYYSSTISNRLFLSSHRDKYSDVCVCTPESGILSGVQSAAVSWDVFRPADCVTLLISTVHCCQLETCRRSS